MRAVKLDRVDPDLLCRIVCDAQKGFNLRQAPRPHRAWRLDNPYSTVLCIALEQDSWNTRVFVKQAKSSAVHLPDLRAQLRVEYDVLCRQAQSPLGLSAAAISPLAYYDDLPALVTKGADGPTLRQIYARDARVWSMPRARMELVQRVGIAGQWLARFQEHSAQAPRPFPIDELLRYLTRRLRRLQETSRGRRDREWCDRLERAAMLLAEECGEQVSICGRHNDYASHNMIAGLDGSLRILDFQAYDSSVAAYDACNFWLELEWLKLDPSYAGGLLRQLQQTFLEAYGKTSPDQPAFQLARLRYTVNRLLNELDRQRLTQRLSLRRLRSVRRAEQWLAGLSEPATPATCSP